MILPLLLAAASFQDTAGLDRAVAAFAGHEIGAQGGARTPIDPRLRLAQCPTVAISWRTERHDAVVVACSGPEWRIFVPVAITTPTAVAATSTDAPPVKLDPVIRRGDAITIEAGDDSFSITRDGIALADAAPGARFLVRVENAKAPVQAMAIASGRATLPGWGK